MQHRMEGWCPRGPYTINPGLCHLELSVEGGLRPEAEAPFQESGVLGL